MTATEKVNIRPNSSILGILKYIEYETWFALGEFVDNSLESFARNEDAIRNIDGLNYKLKVEIDINCEEKKITIRDNAAGIYIADFPRAFRPAEIPPDNTGLAEFGMGMKSAACWFSDLWSVRTKALNEEYERTVIFDINKIFEDKLEELNVTRIESNKNKHYTVIELLNVNKLPQKKTLGKVKEHLTSIYREFIRKEILVLKIDGEIQKFEPPKILYAPKYDQPNGTPIYWKCPIDFPIEEGVSVRGFVAIREKASTSEAGLALFRRGRVVQGSFDEPFRPEYIFGNSNSFKYQRVFGELHLEGFKVNFTKKGIQWDNNLDEFLKLLRDDLSHKDFPLLQQADKYRVRGTDKDYKKVKKVLDDTVDDLEKNAEKAIIEVIDNENKNEDEQETLTKIEKTIHREFEIRFNKIIWKISIELSYESSLKDLIEIGNCLLTEKVVNNSTRVIGIRLSLTHPFMVEYVGVDNSKIEPILRMVAALGLAEIIAKESGAKTQGEVRRNFNELITNLSKQE